MEEVLAAFAGGANKSEDSQNTQGFDTASKHTTTNKNITRKKSVFTLAAEFFKPNRSEKVEILTTKREKQERIKEQWNPFESLRDFRDSRRRTANFATGHCRSFSPQRNDESGELRCIIGLMKQMLTW